MADKTAVPESTERITPCCGYTFEIGVDNGTGPIFWNPYNAAVQCHNCGQTFTPAASSVAGVLPDSATQLAEQIVGDVFPSMDREMAVRYVRQTAFRIAAWAASQPFARELAQPSAEGDGWIAGMQELVEAAREIDQISLMICSPQAWLNEPERDQIAKAILQLRAALAPFPSPPVAKEGRES